jgi:predicted murein hydrolase (TIGR00659 family)
MFDSEAFWIVVTLTSYVAATWINRRFGKAPILNPTLIAIIGVAIVLFATGTSYQKYFDAVAFIHFLLGTAVVALALPLYQNLRRLPGHYRSVLLSLAAGCACSMLVGLAIAIAAGSSMVAIISLAPKSATAAVSMEISRLIGGTPAITGVFTIITGIMGAAFGPYVLDLANVRAPEARGIALGVVSHGIATARAFTEGEVTGSFASLGMTLNAVMTSLLVPPVLRLLGVI